MSRLDALLEISQIVRAKRDLIAQLSKDPNGKPSNIELRKLIAVDPELAFALAAVIATVYYSIEHEASMVASNSFERRAT